jgi:hypothetical protein
VGRSTPYTQAILRFTPDGRVPRANPSASPVLALGFARPSGLVWDEVGRRFWLAGDDPRSPTTVATLPPNMDVRTPWPWIPTGVLLQGASSDPPRPPQLAVTAEGDGATPATVWLVSPPGTVQRAVVHPEAQRLQFGTVLFSGIGNVTMVAGAPRARLYVVAESARERGRTDIWELSRP